MPDRPHLKGIASRWAGRTLATARVGAEVGRAAARKVVDKALDRLDDDWDGETLADRLDGLKGLSMKLGQMASYLDGAVPEKAQKALRRLQSNSKPIEWPVVEAALLAAYSRPPTEIFSTFQPEPFAAASIGQVHRAQVGGREVAVKVQYPEIAKAIEVDLANLGRFGLFGTIGSAVTSGPLIQELRDRLREECDYRQEAANQLYFRSLFADDHRIIIPDVHADLVRERVLVSEFVQGRSFADFVAGARQEERSHAGLLIYEFIWRSIWAHSLFNGDPHPGNYLFLDDARVAFLDFGCVRVFDAAFVDRWKAMARVVLAGDRARWPAACDSIGIVGSRKFDYDAQWKLMEYLYEPVLSKRFRFTPEYVHRSWDVLVWDSPNRRHTAMPPEWLLANRLQWGMNSVLAALGAEGDFGTVFRAALEMPTQEGVRPTPLR